MTNGPSVATGLVATGNAGVVAALSDTLSAGGVARGGVCSGARAASGLRLRKGFACQRTAADRQNGRHRHATDPENCRVHARGVSGQFLLFS